MFERARDLVVNHLFTFYVTGDLTVYEGLKLVTDYLATRGVKTLKELPTNEIWDDAVKICQIITDHVEKKRDAE